MYMNFYDTKALIRHYRSIKDEFIISSVTVKALRDIAESKSNDEDTREVAKKVIEFLCSHEDLYKCIHVNSAIKSIVRKFNLDESNDALLCACAKKASEANEDMTFYVDDINCREIAKLFKIKHNKYKKEEVYKGYKYIECDSASMAEVLNLTNNSPYTWNENEFLIGHETDTNKSYEMRYFNGRFHSLRLPNDRDGIKGKNALQRCALDLLNNNSIPIVAILGGYGSGKTFLCMNMAVNSIKNSRYDKGKIIAVREPRGEGKDIGFLPGDVHNKIDNFFAPLEEQLDNGFMGMNDLKMNEELEVTIPYYIKGHTYNNAIMLVDEAEDLTAKQIRLIGTRLGENSRIFWSGDYKQSVINNSENNALVEMVNSLKNNPMFGCIYLDEDVRSSASKLYATLLQ